MIVRSGHGLTFTSKGGTLSNAAPSTITGNVYEYASGQYSGPGTLGDPSSSIPAC